MLHELTSHKCADSATERHDMVAIDYWLLFYCNADGSASVDGLHLSLTGSGAVSRVEDLHAKANHYRDMGRRVTDLRSLKAMAALASELDREADAVQKEEQCGGDSSTSHWATAYFRLDQGLRRAILRCSCAKQEYWRL